jgi:hypothetical protein
MKRLVWGIILIAIGVVSFAAVPMKTTQDPVASIVGGFLFVAGGGMLAYFGQRYRSRKSAVTDASFQMLKEREKIDAAELSRRLGFSETEVRQYIMESQRAGLLPLKAEIV